MSAHMKRLPMRHLEIYVPSTRLRPESSEFYQIVQTQGEQQRDISCISRVSSARCSATRRSASNR